MSDFRRPETALPVFNQRDYQRQRQMKVDDLLLDNRIIFLYGAIDPRNENGSPGSLVMKLLFLQSENRRKDIHLYIDSPGGDLDGTLAIYDTMQILSCPVSTYCVGLAASGAAVLLAGGAKQKRFALPHSKVMIHQPQIPWVLRGQASDIEIAAEEIVKSRAMLNTILAEHSGQPVEQVAKDTDRDFYMSAEEAKQYGIVDDILTKQKTEEDEDKD